VEGGRNLARAALIGTVQMLAGAPEIILFTWSIAALMCVGRAMADRRCPDAPDCPVTPSLGRSLARLGAMIGLVSGCSAVQLLPFLDLLAHSHREVIAGTDDWAMPAWGWANLVSPLFRTGPSHFGVRFQPGQYHRTIPALP
jgi:hypothetical protein